VRGAGGGFQVGQVTEGELRQAIIVLSKLTNWGLAEVLELEMDEFWAYFKQAQIVENEISKQLRGK
jgi:hypothetical protein